MREGEILTLIVMVYLTLLCHRNAEVSYPLNVFVVYLLSEIGDGF